MDRDHTDGKETQRWDKNHQQNQSEGRGEGTVRYGQERWKERLKWTKTQEKDQVRGW